MGRGVFISFEGGDGVGKTTQVELLTNWLEDQGVSVRRTREPGATALGAQLRSLLLGTASENAQRTQITAKAEALLFAADRAQHVNELINPALAAGQVVVTDRYIDSSVAYQGAARRLGAEEVRDLSLWATDNLLPDLTLLLDADPQLAAKRVHTRSGQADAIEAEGLQFQYRLREQFHRLAEQESTRIKIIDASVEIEQIAAQVRALVSELLKERGIIDA